jgi:hypothetical protein
MFRSICFYICCARCFLIVSSLQGASEIAITKGSANEQYDIMRRDEIDTTNTLAIPLDTSEVEEEEEINRAEQRNVFSLPTRDHCK